MVLVVPQQDHEGLISFEEAIDVTRQALEEQGHHPEYNTTRHRNLAENGARISGFQAVVPSLDGVGFATHTQQVATAEGEIEYEMDLFHDQGRYPMVYVVFNGTDTAIKGILLGQISAEEMPQSYTPTTGTGSAVRTSAISAVGLDHLAPTDASTLGILGSGMLARNHLVAFDSVRDFDSVTVYSPTKAHREAYAAEMPAFVSGVDITTVDGPQAVVEDADVVLCATNSSEPVFDGDWLEPGQTVISVVGSHNDLVEQGFASSTRREVDDTTVERADRIVANSVEQVRVYEQGNLYPSIESGAIDWDDILPLHQVVVDPSLRRAADDEIVYFSNNCGIGMVDVGLASRVIDHVRAVRRGTEVPVYNPNPYAGSGRADPPEGD